MSGYGEPPPYGGMPPASDVGGEPPPNNLVWAILSTVFCCLPLGIVSIVFAAQVNAKWSAGDRTGARESAARARQWAVISAVVGLVVIVLYVIFILGAGLAFSPSGTDGG